MTAHPSPFIEANALLLAAARAGEPASAPSIGADLDWDYLGRAAERQGVAALLHDWLRRHPGAPVDAVCAEALHESYWSGHFRNRLLLEELQRVAQAAADLGIEIMPLKGAHLAPRLYPAPAFRPLSDLDLLIHPRDVARLGALLQSMGYAEVDHSPSYVDDEWLDLDSRDYCWFAIRQGFDALIEYRVAPLELAVGRLTDLDRAHTDALRRHAREVWTRSTRSPDGTMRVQSPEDLLLHVATHLAAKHLDFRLIWLHDLARIVLGTPELDWSYVITRSADLRMAAPVAAALEAARCYAGAPIADAPIDAIVETMGPPSSVSLAHRDLVRLRRHVDALPGLDLTFQGPGVWPLGSALSRVRGWRSRLRVLRWVLLPGRGYLEHRGTAGGGVLGRVTGSVKRLVLRARRPTAPRRG
ncbi:MAG: nucleotidyltransferase family protein [Acidobacteria bacterium]|nr:nucleotidyltransferase family protein [Acidobacteriota bacterium]